MKTFLSVALILASLGLCSTGCVATGLPQILNVFPLDGQTNVDSTIASLSVTFKSPGLSTASVGDYSIAVHVAGTTAVDPSLSGQTSYDPDVAQLTFKFNTAPALQPDTTYEAVLSGPAQAPDSGVSETDSGMSDTYSWTFTTGPSK